MTAQQRLDDARTALHEGRHAEALAGLAWYYAHALDESPSFSGVRGSYCLSAWAELAARYRPARAALDAVRAAAVTALMRGDGTVRLFHEVVGIDGYLKQPDATYRLYLALEEQQAPLAGACANVALDAIVDAGDFVRAARIVPLPDRAIRAAYVSMAYNLRWTKGRYMRAPTRWAYIRIYGKDVQRVLAIVQGTGDAAQAAALAVLAVAQVADPSVRRDMAAFLAGCLPAPMPDQKRWRLQARRARVRATAARRHARTLTKSP